MPCHLLAPESESAPDGIACPLHFTRWRRSRLTPSLQRLGGFSSTLTVLPTRGGIGPPRFPDAQVQARHARDHLPTAVDEDAQDRAPPSINPGAPLVEGSR